MERKYTMAIAALLGLSLLNSCGSPVSRQELVGRWVHPNGATLELQADGSFEGNSLPTGSAFWPSGNPGQFNGQGNWILGAGKQENQVILHFQTSTNVSAGPRFETKLMMDRSEGELFLYDWIEEEGGQRFKMIKID